MSGNLKPLLKSGWGWRGLLLKLQSNPSSREKPARSEPRTLRDLGGRGRVWDGSWMEAGRIIYTDPVQLSRALQGWGLLSHARHAEGHTGGRGGMREHPGIWGMAELGRDQTKQTRLCPTKKTLLNLSPLVLLFHIVHFCAKKYFLLVKETGFFFPLLSRKIFP